MRAAIICLFLGAVCVGTSEFVIAGLLSEISTDLEITLSKAGLLVSAYAIGVALGGPIVTLAVASWQHKTSLCGLMALFVAGQTISIVSASFEGVMLGRILVALCHGSFFGIANVVIVSMVPEQKRGSAVAMLFAGVGLATIMGVPLGTAIGNTYGWRTTFILLSVLGAAVAVSLYLTIPNSDKQKRNSSTGFRSQLNALLNQQTLYALYMFGITRLGFWCLFTFISPFLLILVGIEKSMVPIALLLFGVGAILGMLSGGKLFDTFSSGSLKLMLPLQLIGFFVIMLAGYAPWLVLGLMFIFGFVYYMPSSAMVNRIIASASDAPELAGTLISSVANVGIALGAVLGSQALGYGIGYQWLPLFGVLFASTAIIAMYRSFKLGAQ